MSDKYPGGLVTAAAPAGYSVFFRGGANTDQINTPSAVALTGDFTLECWVYQLAASTSYAVIAGHNAGATQFLIDQVSGGASTGAVSFYQGSWIASSAAGVFTRNAWNHIALTRSGTTVRIFVNGSQAASGTLSGTVNFQNFGSIGTNFTLNGYISNLRITSSALYTAAFTPPTQLLNISNTQLLTCNSPTIVDQSNNAYALTLTSAPAVSTFTPFPSSYYFYNAPTDGNTRNMVPSNIAGFNPAYGAAAPGVWTLDQAQYFAANRLWPIYDPYFNLTTLMLPGNGTNGAQNNTFLDSSTNNFTITRNGNTTQGTFSPFSQTGWGMYGASSGATLVGIFLNGETDFAFGTGDFTIEMFVNLAPSGAAQVIYDSRPSGTNGLYPTIYLDSSATKLKYYTNSADRITQTSTFTYNVWHHVVVTRTGTSTKMFIDGVQEGSTYSDSNNYINSANRPFTGNGLNPDSGVLGYLSNFRVVKGSGPYQSAGSNITVPTSPLTPVTNTVLLTLRSNRFVDTNTQVSAKTVNLLNSPSVLPFSPFAPTAAYSAATVGGSGFFDGTTDNLSAVSGSATALGSGNFTVECWYYQTAAGVFGIFGNLASPSDLQWAFVTANTSGTVRFQGWNTLFLTATEPPRNQWNHIAVSRSGTTLSMFLNGTRVATATNSTNFSDTTNITVGGPNGTSNFIGYISNARVVKGTAVYDPTQTSITVPTSPLTAITNTQFLTNFTNAGITDATAKNVFETLGNAQISTTQSRFGGSSMYFDGNGDYLILPDSTKENLRFGTGDFTIEFWAWKSANGTSGFDTPISVGSTGNFNGGFAVELSASRGFCFLYDAAVRISFSLNPNDSTWHHYAVVRNGSTFALYRDGVQLTTATLTPTLGITGFANIANGANGTTFFNGYIDDLRVTKGFARYTTNFVPPTSALQLQ